MKALSFLAALLMSSVALAYPAVSDYSRFAGTSSYQGQVTNYTVELELLSFDPAAGTYVNRTTVTSAGTTNAEDEAVPSNKLVTREMVLSLLANCAGQGGQSSQITVPAGTFDVCVLTSVKDGMTTTLAIADVPFGVAQIVNTSADYNSVMSLESYRFGN